MRKTISILAMALCSAFAMAQTNQVVWLNGKVLYGHPITTIDSITYDMSGILEGDTLSLILPRSTRYVVYDTTTLVKSDTVYMFDTIIRTNIVYVKDTIYINKCNSEGIGVFSVFADKQVSFAPGNLQYQASTNTWHFAENQYDMLGTDNVVGGTEQVDTGYGYRKEGSALADKIDLFGWGTGNNPTNTSTDDSDYSTFVDWGTNIIGADASNTWRTLTSDEWHYLFVTRTNADKLFGFGTVNGVYGMIILPDNFSKPSSILWTPYVTGGKDWSANTYTLDQWATLQAIGAVFLPASGGRYGSIVHNMQEYGFYWSATFNSDHAFHLRFSATWEHKYLFYGLYRYTGYAVRLVQDL